MNKLILVLTGLIMLIFLRCGKSMHGPQIVTQEISYSADTLQMKGFLAYDQNLAGKRPGILVVHEWWGHNEYARKRAKMLAELGYIALAVDMYGNGLQADHPGDAQKFAMAVMQDTDQAKLRFNAAQETLKKQEVTDPDKIAAIGYCFGGGVALHMARAGFDLDGVASFHGSIATTQPAGPGEIKAKILVCNGADDPFVTTEQIDAFKAEMDSAGAEYKFINYAGARHSFTNPDANRFGQKFNLPLVYNEKADRESWQEMQNFLRDIFK